TAQINVEARDYDNRPVQTAFHLVLQSWNFRGQDGDVVFTIDGNTDANGHAEVRVPLTKGGSLRATITASTPEGRTLETKAYIWVPDRNSYWGGERARIQII